ncbi:hypothetical protein T439DRAFT_325846 [Meredithblackwellia eburnea MCA 4105]
MTSRRIPIGSGQRPPPRPQPGHFQSSLDLVFSFSRSQAFFGSNLPSSPSFVARYRRPGFPEDEESTAPSDGGFDGSGSRGPGTTTTTSDDGTRGGEESLDEGGGWSDDDGDREMDDGIDARAISWDSDVPQREQLPRNAVANQAQQAQSSSRKSSRSRNRGGGPGPSSTFGGAGGAPQPHHGSFPPPRRQPSSEGSTSQSDQPRFPSQPGPYSHSPSLLNPASASPSATRSGPSLNERSPLISRRISTGNDTTHSFSPPDSVPFPRRTPLVNAALIAHNNNHHQNGGVENGNGARRRLSVISAEAWKEAIEESRGMSTFGQTLFNTVNVLIGVGLLAEPLAFADAGWFLGSIILTFCALVTNYTAKMLAKIMSQDPTLLNFSDVLIKAYGPKARPFIHLAFVCELTALSIALVVLFSDSMSTLIPRLSPTFFKFIAFAIILPTTYLPLRFLSITSLIGILSSFMLLFVLYFDGIWKRYPPGSLWVPMHTDFGPRWGRLPLSFGLLMSGFAGHAVIPSLYRDMKEPKHFDRMINMAYFIAFGISMLMGAAGYAMFGNDVSDEVTRDLRRTHGYPAVLNQIAVWMIAINPVVKYALASLPLVATIEHLIGVRKDRITLEEEEARHSSSGILDGSAIASEEESSSYYATPVPVEVDPEESAHDTPVVRATSMFIIRPVVMGLVVLAAILIPNFGIVLSFLGSSSAFLVCAIGPIGAYLIIGQRKEPLKNNSGLHHTSDEPKAWEGLGPLERILCWVLLIISTLLAVIGTLWTCMPALHSRHR